MNGHGVLTLKSGSKYEGNFVNDQKEGNGIFTWANGEQFSGEWIGGKQHGIANYTKDGLTRQGVWHYGHMQHWLDHQTGDDKFEQKELV